MNQEQFIKKINIVLVEIDKMTVSYTHLDVYKRQVGVELMESEELTSKILLESVLECTNFVVNEVPNLYSAVIERLKQDDEVFFMNFVEDEDGQDDYYGYVYNKTNGKIYEYAFHDDKLVKNRKLSFTEKKIGELTTKDILELPIIDLL